ncbi:MAG: NAD(P)/FAD-dependent oxidoreductase [Butyrivibrio sp.]|nr:NAD(P)/FAD-dependent oxidoreductase [Butyrivibrio sp.]
MKKIAIIGCGASGMMAAAAAAENGAAVTIYEKNEKPGKKLFITGKGRCNLTNTCDTEAFFSNVCHNAKFLYSAVYGYDKDFVMDFFERNGCALKEERGGRVFPVSDHSSDVIRTLVHVLQELHVQIRYGSKVTKITYQDGTVKSLTVNGKENIAADAVIVCTGGLSYESTGSTGDGYHFAVEAGHSIIEQTPSLVPLTIKEPWCTQLQGLSLKNVSVRMERSGEDTSINSRKSKVVYEGFGEMLFTHFGVSGPLILTASTCYEPGTEMILHLDLKPALSQEQLDKRILRDFEEGLNKQFGNILGGLFPAKLIPVIISLSGIDPEKRVNDISRQERQLLVQLTKNITMTVTGTRGYPEAIITRGGVNVKEINASTMESKFCRGLYFAGEVMDLDAVTGGFNLQIAWSTGHLAGVNAAAEA